MSKPFISIGIVTLLFSGCSMLPYENNFACEGGSNVKVCKRVSDVYQMDMDNYYKQQNMQSKKNFYTKDYYEYQIKKLQSKNKIIDNQNKDLKDIIDGVTISKLEKPIQIEIKNTTNTHRNTKKILNKYIKVCVLNANIRQAPNCKAKIVKVAHKGDKLFALYEKNGWIKLKNNNFINRSITNEKCN